MPDRIVRDELLRSHRYVTLSSDTVRLLFVHFILSADAYANAEATTTALGLIMGRQVDGETAAKWLQELNDCDLIRCYESGGKRYIHIPRYRQRLRYLTSRHPRPPVGLECSELKDLLRKVGIQSGDSQARAIEVKRSEEKRSEVNQTTATSKPVHKSRSTPEDEAKQRRIAERLVVGDVEGAKKIKAEP